MCTLFWSMLLFCICCMFACSVALYVKVQCGYGHRLAPSNTQIQLSCDSGERIRVLETYFGRTQPGSVVCPMDTHDHVTDCVDDYTSEYKAQCNGLRQCIVDITSITPDPCRGTYKYINSTYLCFKDITETYFQNVPGPMDEACPMLRVDSLRGHTKVKYILPEPVTSVVTMTIITGNEAMDVSRLNVYTNVNKIVYNEAFVGKFKLCKATVGAALIVGNLQFLTFTCDCTVYTCEAVFLALWENSLPVHMCNIMIDY